MRQIRSAARCIARAVQPEKVILFGSHAYGKPTADSDVDFLIVDSRANTRHRRFEMAIQASRALDPRPFPVDILVRSPRQIRFRVANGDFFLREVMSRGRVLYERCPRP
jgi:predicted nucleotidyltransferase